MTVKRKAGSLAAAIMTVAALTVAAVIFSVFSGGKPVEAEAADSAVTLVREAVELVVGETDVLTTKKEVKDAKWTSSDESVVTVDAGGTVKGIKPGSAEVTVSSNSGSAVCRIFVVEKEYSFDDDIMISIFWPPTQNYVNDEQYKLMADAGITWVMGSGDNLGSKATQLKMLELCYKYGIHMTVGDSRLGSSLLNMSEKQIKKVVDEYRNVPGANGYYMLDEPFNPNVFIKAYRILKELDPDSYMHLNFLPYGAYGSIDVYKAQMNDWLKLCEQTGHKQDYLMYDLYPFGLAAGSMNRTGFLLNLNAVREVGLANGVKTGTYIQSVTQEVAFRSPTESETRYEINMALAFGVKQLSYFTWFTPYNRSEPFIDGIIHWDGTPNPKYEFICRLNQEVHNLGPTLVKCDSLEVYQGRNKYDAMELIPDDFFVQSETKADFTVAYLRDRETGRNYCMVVNNNFSKAKDFSLKFDKEITSLEYLSEKDGKAYKQELSAGNVADFELEAGGARLFVLPEGYDFSKKREWVPGMNENLAAHASIMCDSSVGSGGWYMSALNDGVRFSGGGMEGWTPESGNNSGMAVLDFGRSVEFNRVDIYPSGSRFGYGVNMPGSFVLAVSEDAETWYKLAEAKNFKVLSDTAPSVTFETVKARYLRIIASDFPAGKLEICEIEVYNDDGGTPPTELVSGAGTSERGENVVKYKEGKSISKGKPVSVSSYPQGAEYKSWGWWPDFLTDGDLKRGWTSNVKIHMDQAESPEFAIIDLQDYFNIDAISVSPNGCWPEDFEIRISDNMTDWETVASETGSKAPKDVYTLNLGGNKHARYVMFYASKLTRTAADGYMLQLGEVDVTGTPFKNVEEAESLIGVFKAAGGSEDAASLKAVRELLADKNSTQSQLDKAMKEMLEEVGKSIPAAEQAERAVYTFETVDNPMTVKDDTPVPTALPADSTEGPDGPETPGKDGPGKILLVAGIVAGVALLAAAAVVIAVKIGGKKKKED